MTTIEKERKPCRREVNKIVIYIPARINIINIKIIKFGLHGAWNLFSSFDMLLLDIMTGDFFLPCQICCWILKG